MDCGDESDHDRISTEILEDSRGGIQSHPNVNIKNLIIKYMIALGKDNQNGKERQKLRETWLKFYTRYLRLLQKRFRNICHL